MKKIILSMAVIALITTGCATTQRVNTNFQTVQYNDIANQYMREYTEVSYTAGDSPTLDIEMLDYAHNTHYLSFYRDYVDGYIANTEKYLRWAKIAQKSQDILNNKEIGNTNQWTGTYKRFSIYSGNANNHYLSIDDCALGTCSNGLMVNYKGALKLKDLLIKLKHNSFDSVDESKYQ